jgi:chemotaxis protein methyltransferase CheR
MSARDESISDRDYTRLCDLIYKQAGIHLGSGKKTMLEVRIKRRLKDLNLPSYSRYCDYLFSGPGLERELTSFIDVITTNKTDFFREPQHFDFLSNRALPELSTTGRPFLLWSAGCSTGEEPYTLAMLLSEYGLAQPGFQFHILATDICTTVLSKAALGIFPASAIKPVPGALVRKYFLRGRSPGSDRVRIVPELRRLIEFRRLNFMDADYGIAERADIIFCRNVIIYFDRPTQQRILSNIARHLVPGGYLFVGHAEVLRDMDLPLIPIAPALYKRTHARA